MGPSLETERLRLEPLDAVHAQVLHRIYGEPDVARYLFSRASSPEEFETLFQRALSFRDTHGMWAVVQRSDDRLLGRVGFFAFGTRERPELAFLLSRSVWGRGLATEACRAAIRYALAHRDWPEIVAVVHPGNLASMRVLEKLGFSEERSLTLNGAPARLFQAPLERLRDLA